MIQDMFPESIEDAIGNDVQAIRGGYKTVAASLWPSINPSSAYARLKNCLRDDKDEKLSPSELLLIKQWARDVGSRSTIDFELGACHCAVSQPVEPETELARLLREHAEQSARLDASNRRLVAAMEHAGIK